MVMGCEAGVQMTPQNIVISNLYLCCAGMYPVSRPGDRSRAAAECDKCGLGDQGTTDQWSQAELFLLSPSPVCLARPGPTNCAGHWAMVDTCEPPQYCLAAPPPSSTFLASVSSPRQWLNGGQVSPAWDHCSALPSSISCKQAPADPLSR